MLEAILQNLEVEEACKDFDVKRLHVFGSAVSEEAEESNDIDFVVEFEREGYSGAFDQFMGFKEALENVLGKPVDLLVSKRFRNPVFQDQVDKTKKLVYAA
jgi:hypothetical protein